MNWFRKKKEQTKKLLPEIPPEWEALLAKFPVGRTFTYLGRELIVASHTREYDCFLHCLSGIYLDCEYCDNEGKLREWRFHIGMSNILRQLT